MTQEELDKLLSPDMKDDPTRVVLLARIVQDKASAASCWPIMVTSPSHKSNGPDRLSSPKKPATIRSVSVRTGVRLDDLRKELESFSVGTKDLVVRFRDLIESGHDINDLSRRINRICAYLTRMEQEETHDEKDR